MSALSYTQTVLIAIATLSLCSFSCGSDEEDEEPLENGSGNVTFYFNEPMPCAEVEIVFVDKNGNEARGKIRGTSVHPGVPACSEVPSVSFMNRYYGTYTYSIICGTRTINEEVALKTPCHTIKIEP